MRDTLRPTEIRAMIHPTEIRAMIRPTEIRAMIHPTEIRVMSEEHIRRVIIHQRDHTIRIGETLNREMPMETAKSVHGNVAPGWGNVYSRSSAARALRAEITATAAGEINPRTGIINL
jgi:hypothetical protein